MMVHGDLFSNRPANDYPLFKSSWDAADRLVSWMREHGMHSALRVAPGAVFVSGAPQNRGVP